MSITSDIEWTDATWNPVRGCTKVSPGCANCYAETFSERWRGVQGHAYEQGFDLRLVPEKLAEPLKWKKPLRIFVNSMSDLFQDGVPDAFIDKAFAVMAMCPQHTFQVLTKRPDRMRAYLLDGYRPAMIDAALLWAVGVAGRPRKTIVQPNVPSGTEDWPLPNVWIGVSVENQHFANERLPLLMQTPAAVRFVSLEPLLEPVNLASIRWETEGSGGPAFVDLCKGTFCTLGSYGLSGPKLDWVIVGGESGHGARPFDLDWARDVVASCKASGVPVFVKQFGAQPYDSGLTESGRNESLHYVSRKGGDMAEWPADLRVREFPAAHR